MNLSKETAYKRYQYEVALYEQYGSKNVITFEEWLEIKGIILE